MVEGDPLTGRDDSLFNSSQVVRRKPQTQKTTDGAVVFNIQKESVQYQAGFQATSRRKSAAGSDEIIHPDGKTSAQLTPERRKIRRSSSGSSEIYHLRRTPSVSSVASISEDVPRVSWNRVLTSIRHGQSLSISAVTDKIVDHDVTAFWHVEIATNMAKYQRWKGEIVVPTGHNRGQTTISIEDIIDDFTSSLSINHKRSKFECEEIDQIILVFHDVNGGKIRREAARCFISILDERKQSKSTKNISTDGINLYAELEKLKQQLKASEELNAQIQLDLDAAKGAFDDLQKDFDTQSAQINRLKNEKADFENHNDTDDAKLANANKELADLEAVIAQLKDELATKDLQITNLQWENDIILKTPLDAKTVRSKNEQDEPTEDIYGLKMSVIEKQEEIDELNALLADLRKQLADSNAENDKLKSDNIEKDKALDIVMFNMDSLTTKVRERGQEIDDLKALLDGMKNDMEKMKNELDDEKAENLQLRSENDDLASQLKLKTDEIQKLQDIGIKSLKDRIGELEKEKEEAEFDAFEMKVSLKAAEEEIEELKKLIDELREAKAKAEQEIEELKTAKMEQDEEVLDLKWENDIVVQTPFRDAEMIESSMAEDVDIEDVFSLRTSIKESEEENKALQKIIDDLNDEIQRLIEEQGKSLHKIKALEDEKEILKQIQRDLTDERADLEAKLNACTTCGNEKDIEIDEYKKNLNDYEDLLKQLRLQLEQLEEKERLGSQAEEDLKNELDAAEKERKLSEDILNNEVTPAIDDLEARQALARLDMDKLISKLMDNEMLPEDFTDNLSIDDLIDSIQEKPAENESAAEKIKRRIIPLPFLIRKTATEIKTVHDKLKLRVRDVVTRETQTLFSTVIFDSPDISVNLEETKLDFQLARTGDTSQVCAVNWEIWSENLESDQDLFAELSGVARFQEGDEYTSVSVDFKPTFLFSQAEGAKYFTCRISPNTNCNVLTDPADDPPNEIQISVDGLETMPNGSGYLEFCSPEINISPHSKKISVRVRRRGSIGRAKDALIFTQDGSAQEGRDFFCTKDVAGKIRFGPTDVYKDLSLNLGPRSLEERNFSMTLGNAEKSSVDIMRNYETSIRILPAVPTFSRPKYSQLASVDSMSTTSSEADYALEILDDDDLDTLEPVEVGDFIKFDSISEDDSISFDEEVFNFWYESGILEIPCLAEKAGKWSIIQSDTNKVSEIVTENSGRLSKGYNLINIRLSVPLDRTKSIGVFKLLAEVEGSFAESLVVLRPLP